MGKLKPVCLLCIYVSVVVPLLIGLLLLDKLKLINLDQLANDLPEYKPLN